MQDAYATEKPKRKKICGPRSKSGCITCRIRRVKCDEKKPSCERCTCTGRRCDGYIDKHQVRVEHVSKQGFGVFGATQPTIIHLSEDRRGCLKELQGFEFFRTYTVPLLAGLFGSTFWDRMILQATHHHPALFHAIVSLGSLHEKFEAGDAFSSGASLDSTQNRFALEQYNKAIGGLLKPYLKNGQQSCDVALTSCVLFACIEALQGHHGSALAHIESGIKILAEAKSHHTYENPTGTLFMPKNTFVPLEKLTVLFVRLDTQLCQLVNNRTLRILTSCDRNEPGFGPSIPSKFSSIEEARNSLDYHWNNATHLVHLLDDQKANNDDSALSRLLEFGVILSQWSSAFENFLSHPSTKLDSRQIAAVNILRIHQIYGAMNLRQTQTNDKMSWDRYTAEFETIIALASQAAKESSIAANPRAGGQVALSKPTLNFSLDAGIVAVLFGLIWKCRVSAIRRKGIHLLQTYPRQEGLWSGLLVAKVGARIVQLEEEGVGEVQNPSDIPVWARLFYVDVKFDPAGRRAWMFYSKSKNRDDATQISVQEDFIW